MNEKTTLGQIRTEDWGLIDYRDAYERQKKLAQEVGRGHDSCLVLCEHPPVLTLGRLASKNNILAPGDVLARQGMDVLEIDRGGDVTLHGPGQLVAYPIMDLKNYRRDLKWFLFKLEQVAIDFLKDFDILTCRYAGRTGVWIESKKIASIGVGAKHWVTFHGLAVNINTDLQLFNLIRPCGLNVQMTSLKELKGEKMNMQVVKQRCIYHFLRHFTRDEIRKV